MELLALKTLLKQNYINHNSYSNLMIKKNGMRFLVKDMDIATGGSFIAILNHDDAIRLDLHLGDRILVKYRHRKITCIVDISESEKAVSRGRLGLFEEVLDSLQVKNNQLVNIQFTNKPESVQHIKDKLDGKILNYKELLHITADITNDRLSDIEKTYFVAGSYIRGLNLDEIINLTKAMVQTGKKIKFSGITLDKHSIGGVPGNRTTMIITPIIAAAGFTMAKTSSRAITSPAGTADVMECLANVTLTEKQIKKVVHKVHACIAHGGAINLAPADDKIITVEHPLSIDAEGQLVASVMAKKYSVSSKHVLIDIPRGKSTKVKTRKQARRLSKIFEKVGQKLGMNVKVIITDGSQPIGRGIGPLLEAEDVLAVLKNDPLAPRDLREKALMMAGLLLEMTGKYRNGLKKALELLESGQALVKMNQIIAAQGKQKLLELGRYHFHAKSARTGKIREIDNLVISHLARIAGTPLDKGAGLYLNKHVGEQISKGEVLYTVYAENEFKLKSTIALLKKNDGYLVK